MKLPRDLPGMELATLLRRYGYEIKRQTGNHLRLTSMIKGKEHHITIPRHKHLQMGTLNAILSDVASYLEKDRGRLIEDLFGT